CARTTSDPFAYW
nr:immunoglobulin heavy chain junction region [Mus musculus]